MLGVAKAQLSGKTLPDQQHDFDFKLLGLIALADPVRPAVPSAIRECQTAGIRVIMITGDYPGTAMSIARQIGLEAQMGPSRVLKSRRWMNRRFAIESRRQASLRARYQNRSFNWSMP